MAVAKKPTEEKKFVFTSKIVDEVTEKINDGVVVKRFQNPWFKNEVGVRRAGLTFMMTEDEIQEYIRCKIDIQYFAEKYCRIKTEDGSVQNIKLRDYQRDILDLYTKNRFSILCGSRQIGKTINAAIAMLHFITFNNDKNIMIVANVRGTTVEIIDKIKNIYIQLPFFLKSAIKNWNQQSMIFENGCRIKSAARSKTPAIGFTIDFLYLDEFAHIPSNIIEPYYTAAFPTVSAIENSKIVITSTPNGMNLFYRLLTDAERPEGDALKNNYKPMRVYWYQVPGRFVTYLRLNNHKLYEHGLTKEDIFEVCRQKWNHLTKIEMGYNSDLQKDIVYVYNNEKCSDEEVKSLTVIDNKGMEIPIRFLAEATTWKEEAIKDIGGEDAFNQEYGLRFINASKSLLNEAIIDELLKNKKNYVFEDILEFEKKIKFSYQDLKWVDDDDLFLPIKRKEYKVVISVDLAEGLGQDYSVINIFRISPKSKELIETQKMNYKSIVDFFRLEQIGIYRSNIISLKQLAELLYLICFEYFNPENVKVVLELNNYGNTLLAEMPHVFDGNNDYGSSVFVRYKHRVDSIEEKVGLKVGENKNILVKDYQDLMLSKGFAINNEDTIREITTFVKHTTTAGNTRYAADVGHDDCVMTIVNATSLFGKPEFREMIDEFANHQLEKEMLRFIQQCLNSIDFVQGVDYGQLLRVKNQVKNTNKYKNSTIRGNNWFGAN